MAFRNKLQLAADDLQQAILESTDGATFLHIDQAIAVVSTLLYGNEGGYFFDHFRNLMSEEILMSMKLLADPGVSYGALVVDDQIIFRGDLYDVMERALEHLGIEIDWEWDAE